MTGRNVLVDEINKFSKQNLFSGSIFSNIKKLASQTTTLTDFVNRSGLMWEAGSPVSIIDADNQVRGNKEPSTIIKYRVFADLSPEAWNQVILRTGFIGKECVCFFVSLRDDTTEPFPLRLDTNGRFGLSHQVNFAGGLDLHSRRTSYVLILNFEGQGYHFLRWIRRLFGIPEKERSATKDINRLDVHDLNPRPICEFELLLHQIDLRCSVVCLSFNLMKCEHCETGNHNRANYSGNFKRLLDPLPTRIALAFFGLVVFTYGYWQGKWRIGPRFSWQALLCCIIIGLSILLYGLYLIADTPDSGEQVAPESQFMVVHSAPAFVLVHSDSQPVAMRPSLHSAQIGKGTQDRRGVGFASPHCSAALNKKAQPFRAGLGLTLGSMVGDVQEQVAIG